MARAKAGLRSGIVLAGGRSSRIGAPKALLELAGEPLLRHVVRALAPACDEIVLVAAPEAAQPAELRDGLAREARLIGRRWRALHGDAGTPALAPRVRVVHDLQPHLGPVSGLATGLAAARGAIAFVAACDVPFLVPALVAGLLERAEADPSLDVVVPRWRGYLEPLLTVYRTASMASHYARQLAENDLKPTACLAAVRVQEVCGDELAGLDPDGRSFVNLNAPADFVAAHALAEKLGRLATGRGSRPARSRRGSSAGG